MKNILLLSSLLLCAALNAQQIKVSGTVKDSIGIPLEMANIIATNQLDGNMENYSISGHDGKFSISLTGGAVYTLTTTFLGMKPASVEVDLEENAAVPPLEIILFADENQLKGVELTYEMPVVVRGDTIVYNTDSFTNGNERKLGDVLDKLPGISVDDNGDIEVEGKKVSKVMVDGRTFLMGIPDWPPKTFLPMPLAKWKFLKITMR